MAQTSEAEKASRKALMAELRLWLKLEGKNQRWLGEKLGIYHGYVSNLLTGKQVPSDAVVEKAKKLMAPAPVVAPRPKPKVKPKAKKARRRIAPGYRPLHPEELRAVAEITKTQLARSPDQSDAELIEILRAVRGGITA